jgi:hypothetical protein
MLKTLEGVALQPITADDVQQARTRWLKQFDEVLNDPEQLAVGLSESIALGDWRLLFLHRDRIRAVAVADVQRAAIEFLKPSNRTLGQFVPTDKPDRAPLPSTIQPFLITRSSMTNLLFQMLTLSNLFGEMWHHFSGKQLHAAHDLRVRDHAARVEPTDHASHTELLLEALEAFHTSVRRIKDGHDITHLLVGHVTHPLQYLSEATLRKRTSRGIKGREHQHVSGQKGGLDKGL